MNTENMREYYDLRAPVFDRVYAREDRSRQASLHGMAVKMTELCRDRNVLEVGCGTGFWTAQFAHSARRVTSVDYSQEMLKQCRQAVSDSNLKNVDILQADMYNLPFKADAFDAMVVNFIMSHVPLERMREWLEGLFRTLKPSATVFFCDNEPRGDCGGELIRNPDDINTYKKRFLDDGSEYLILKNYFTETELRRHLAPFMTVDEYHADEYYWWVKENIILLGNR